MLVLVPKGISTLENTESLAFKIVWMLKGTRFINLSKWQCQEVACVIACVI